jgi:hypothetical protein
MKNEFDLVTTTPREEQCVNVGDTNYYSNAQIEAKAYINQLKRNYGNPPPGTRFKIIDCPHDAGVYVDIRFFYDDECCEHNGYFDYIERGCDKWDQVALAELKENNYSAPGAKVIPLNSKAA